MKKKIILLLLLLSPFFVSAGSASDSLKVRNCYVPLPAWWSEVKLTLPDSITSLELLQQYSETLRKDTAMGNNYFIKSMMLGIEQLNIFPAYIGDAYFEIGEYDEAIAVYEHILPCTKYEKGRSAEWECYLYYMIGKCFEMKKDKENALVWYRKAIDVKFQKGNPATADRYNTALCAYRCLMNIRCDN